MNTHIDTRTYARLWEFISRLGTEVGGFGYGWLLDNGDIEWNEVFLVPQEVTVGGVDFEATNGDDFAVQRAVRDEVLGKEGFIWVSWHSHGSLETFWSSTDEKRIDGLGKAGLKYVLSFVGNHKREYNMRLDCFGVEHHGITIPQVTMNDVHLVHNSELVQEVAAEITANVRKPPKPKFVPTHNQFSFTKQAERQEQTLTKQAEQEMAEDMAYAMLGLDEDDASEIQQLIQRGCDPEKAREIVLDDWAAWDNGFVNVGGVVVEVEDDGG